VIHLFLFYDDNANTEKPTRENLQFDLSQSDLTPHQKQQLTSFLHNQKHVFATNLKELGVARNYHHKIEFSLVGFSVFACIVCTQLLCSSGLFMLSVLCLKHLQEHNVLVNGFVCLSDLLI
jgi:hypothetical protein